VSLSSGTRLGPYEVLAPLGAGGMGEVYRARDTRLDRTVAIKVLPDHLAQNPDLRQRFEREARAVSSLNHPTSACSTTSDTRTEPTTSCSSTWRASRSASGWRRAPCLSIKPFAMRSRSLTLSTEPIALGSSTATSSPAT
jgi:serine/threonine protein kinase